MHVAQNNPEPLQRNVEQGFRQSVELTQEAAQRQTVELVVGVELQVDGVGRNARVDNFNEGLGQGVHRLGQARVPRGIPQEGEEEVL